jgi:ribosomal protein S18 acetylase RimI-like enzyme
MELEATAATGDDVDDLARLYRVLARELAALKPVWCYTEALPEPARESLGDLVADPSTTVLVGRIDGVAVGFLVGTIGPLLPQAGDARLASVTYLFTEPDAREVGVAETLLGAFMDEHVAAGVRHFDAHVSPGHRLAKNFFESNGFKARHIVMHHEADR